MKHLSSFLTKVFAFGLGASFICASLALGEIAQPEPAAPEAAVAVPRIDHQELAAVSGKLNQIKTLKANFTQIDAKGTAEGRFYLSRPGGVRFEYDPPRKLLVVANDRTLAVQESPNIAPYRVGVDQTPLRLLLKTDLDLAQDANIVDAHREGNLLFVTAMETKGYGQGQVTFIFSGPDLDLKRWVVVDPMGTETVVTLSNLEPDATLDKQLFKLPPPPRGSFGPIR